jgi:hypothetical protein
MGYRRHIAGCVTTGMTLALLATTAAPAAASVEGPKLVTTWAAAVKPATPTWLELFWTTGKKVCDVKVTVEGADIDVTYPANTADHTSFSQSDRLKAGQIDETSINVTANYPTTAYVALKATMNYDYCAPKPTTKTETYWITLPVLDKS